MRLSFTFCVPSKIPLSNRMGGDKHLLPSHLPRTFKFIVCQPLTAWPLPELERGTYMRPLGLN